MQAIGFKARQDVVTSAWPFELNLRRQQRAQLGVEKQEIKRNLQECTDWARILLGLRVFGGEEQNIVLNK